MCQHGISSTLENAERSKTLSPPPVKPRIIVGNAGASATLREKLLALLLLLLGVAASVVLTYFWSMAANVDIREQVIELVAERDALQNQLEAARQQLAVAQRGDQVTRNANDQLRNEFIVLQEELAALRADIEFYQRLLGAAGAGNGLAVHGLQLEHTAAEQVYRFELTLSQNLKKARIVVGQVELFVDGVRDGRAHTLDVAAKDVAGIDDMLSFQFKYFQLLRGSFTLPEGFIAERVRIRLVVQKGRNSKPLWREFTWTELFGPVTHKSGVERVQ